MIALVPLPRVRARPVARRPALRGAARARASACAALPRPEKVLRRRDGRGQLLARARGGDVRVRAVVPGRGAEHVLRRAAVPDRAARLDRPRPAARHGLGDGGDHRRGGAARRAAVLEPDRPERALGHDRADPARLARRAGPRPRRRRARGRLRLRGARACCSCSCRGGTRSCCRCSCSSTSPSRRRRSRRSTTSSRSSRCSAASPSPPLHRDWIDRTVGSNAKVAAVWTGNTDKFTIWENEFFNRSVGTVYATGPPLPGRPSRRRR